MEAKMDQSVTFNTAWGWMGMTASAKGAQAGVSRIILPQASRRAVERELSRPLTRALAPLNGRTAAGAAQHKHTARVLREARAHVVAFLEGKRRALDFPINLSGGSAFRRRVWRAIVPIPYGRVRSYKWVARRVGGTHYARAVGHALGANPVPIVIPCHRVVAHDASLGGFTGGLRPSAAYSTSRAR